MLCSQCIFSCCIKGHLHVCCHMASTEFVFLAPPEELYSCIMGNLYYLKSVLDLLRGYSFMSRQQLWVIQASRQNDYHVHDTVHKSETKYMGLCCHSTSSNETSQGPGALAKAKSTRRSCIRKPTILISKVLAAGRRPPEFGTWNEQS